jgi:hypothetical protein
LQKLKLRTSAAIFLQAAVFSLILQLIAIQARAQGQQPERNPVTKAIEMLPDNPGGEWRAVNQARVLKSDEWSVLPDASIYSEYGLQRLHSRSYGKGSARATVEIFEMRYPSGAYGLYTFNRSSLSPDRREFHLANYLISIDSSLNEKDLDSAFAEILRKKSDTQSSALPILPAHLPEENKIAGTEKYLVGPAALANLKGFGGLAKVVRFDGGVEIATADYQNGDGMMSLMIVEYHTPQTALDGLKAFTKYIDSLQKIDKGSRVVKRVGNYLIYAINIKDSAGANNLIGKIKYEYKVYWEGRKISDIPLEFRPPDPVAIEEANRTMLIMVRSFFWVGVLMSCSILLGLLAGSGYFFWRRYRRRKLGLDDLFSDAGGTISLNLDGYLLQPGQPAPLKQLGDGKN